MTNGFGQLLGALIREEREALGMTQRELAEESFPDLQDHEGKERRIRELELGDVTRPQSRNFTPICETLNIDRKTIADLKKRASDKAAQDEAEFQEVIDEHGSLASALAETSALDRNELERLADRFGIEGFEIKPDGVLAQLLSIKAEEYRALQAEVNSIGDSFKRLSNIKNAAKDAIIRGNLQEVEDRLSQVMAIELEEAAKTAELRADNALLRGRFDQAYDLLSSVAYSFSASNEHESVRRRLHYGEVLRFYGCNFQNDALLLSIRMLEAGISEELERQAPLLWASLQNLIGDCLADRGARISGQAAIELLDLAIFHFNAALKHRKKERVPIDWSVSQNDLGTVYFHLGVHASGAVKLDHLDNAINCHESALSALVPAESLSLWAMVKGNLANALHEKGIFYRNEKAAEFFALAIAQFRELLTSLDAQELPVDRATAQYNLSRSLKELGTLTDGPKGQAMLHEACSLCHEALSVRSKTAMPIRWAMTKDCLAGATKALAMHETTENPLPLLQAALKDVEDALEVYHPEEMSLWHLDAVNLRKEILELTEHQN